METNENNFDHDELNENEELTEYNSPEDDEEFDEDDGDDYQAEEDAEEKLEPVDNIVNTASINPLLESIEFMVTCELAGVKLSINELSELRLGDQLPLVSDLQQIRVRVNDVVIGYGELVKVDDKYGLKINKLLSAKKLLQ